MVEADGRNLVLLLSTPRAGSTMLAAMLGSHPEVLAPPEPWLLLPLFALGSNVSQIIAAYDDQLARTALHAMADPPTLARARGAFATTIYNAALSASGKRLCVDKTPRYYHLTDQLDAVFPRAKKIWLLRNPLDVVASCVETWKLPLDEVLGNALSPHSFDATIAFARLAAYFAQADDDRFTVRYEEFVSNPGAHLARVCEHLGVAFVPAMLDYKANTALMQSYAASPWGDRTALTLDGPTPAAVGRWRTSLSPADVGRVLQTLGSEIFATLGYATELNDALAFAGLQRHALSTRGRLDELQAAATDFAVRNLPDSPGGRRTKQVAQITDLQRQLAATEPARSTPRWRTRLGLLRRLASRQF